MKEGKMHLLCKKDNRQNSNICTDKKTYRKIFLVITLFVLTLCGAASCEKCVSPQPDPDPGPTPTEQVVFSGRVIADSGEAVSGAEVDVNGTKEKTDGGGSFKLKVDKLEDKNKRYLMNIQKPGYGLFSEKYSAGVEGKKWVLTKGTVETVTPTAAINVTNIRTSGSCRGSLSSRVDWSLYPDVRYPMTYDSNGNKVAAEISPVAKAMFDFAEQKHECSKGISVSIPANALRGQNGAAPSGDVQVAVSTVDIYTPGSMPGDNTVMVDGKAMGMRPYGAGTIDITAEGEMFQLDKEKTATIKVPVDPTILKTQKQIPETIPLILYNEEKGVWTVEGEGRLNRERNAYEAKVRHFSTFNMDLVKTDRACVRIDGTGITGDFDLEAAIEGDPTSLRVKTMQNTAETRHIVFRIPEASTLNLRAFTVGDTLSPIISKTVNTGIAYSDSVANPPPGPPYDVCGADCCLSEDTPPPVLTAKVSDFKEIKLTWDYTWPDCRPELRDGFSIEEAVLSGGTAFTLIANVASGDTSYTMTGKDPDTYWYRIKPNYNSCADTIYGDTVGININILRIENNLDDDDSIPAENWKELNQIVKVNLYAPLDGDTATDCGNYLWMGATIDGATYGEKLNQADTLPLGEPEYPVILTADTAGDDNWGNNFKEFDISNIDKNFCVFVQTGKWEPSAGQMSIVNTSVTRCPPFPGIRLKNKRLLVNYSAGTTHTVKTYDDFLLPHKHFQLPDRCSD
jgi:hypothetical protein